MPTTWNYVAHIRKPDQQEVIELSGTFVGNHMQAFAHLQSLATLHEGILSVHKLGDAQYSTTNVKRLTAPAPTVVPVAVPVEPPALPQGCEWADEQPSYVTEEYNHHGDSPSEREAPSHSLH